MEPHSPLPARCRLCETPLPDPGARCPSCGMDQARDVPGDGRWRLAAGLAAVYAVVAVVLALTR